MGGEDLSAALSGVDLFAGLQPRVIGRGRQRACLERGKVAVFHRQAEAARQLVLQADAQALAVADRGEARHRLERRAVGEAQHALELGPLPGQIGRAHV